MKAGTSVQYHVEVMTCLLTEISTQGNWGGGGGGGGYSVVDV